MAQEKAMKKTEQERALNTSERFQNMVLSEFGGNVSGELRVTDYQRHLIQGYFIMIDRALKKAEEERMRKNNNNRDHKYDNKLPITWGNVNLTELALDVVHYARIGLDMMEPNHLFPIPFKNNKTEKYDVNLMIGYNGIKYIANNYALDKPKAVRIELVHKTDYFKPIKKGRGNDVETYEFDIENPFDRGPVIGGFGYLEFNDQSKNELVLMSLHDMNKRKPKYASANFWGGTIKGDQVEGWLEEMYTKTLIREVYSPKHIPRDPRKIDESYQYMKQQEVRLENANADMRQAIDVEANSIDFEAVAQIPEPVPAPAVPTPAVPASNMASKKNVPKQEPEKQAPVADSIQNPYEEDEPDEIEHLGEKMFEDMSTSAGPNF